MEQVRREQFWEIVVRARGIAKRQRTVKQHRFTVDDFKQSHDVAPDLETYKAKALELLSSNMRSTDKVVLSALPYESDAYNGGIVMRSMRLFDPRAKDLVITVTP